MSCKIFGDISPLSKPTSGNTYEITIGPYDRLIVTVQSPNAKHIKTKTEICPIGIEVEAKDNGQMCYKTDFHIRHK